MSAIDLLIIAQQLVAREIGPHKLESSALVTVNIIDANDHSPRFDRWEGDHCIVNLHLNLNQVEYRYNSIYSHKQTLCRVENYIKNIIKPRYNLYYILDTSK